MQIHEDIIDMISADVTEQILHHKVSDQSILIVEDNEKLKSFLCESLLPFYKILEAENSLQGLENAKKNFRSRDQRCTYARNGRDQFLSATKI